MIRRISSAEVRHEGDAYVQARTALETAPAAAGPEEEVA
jgi:hypothetical protein